MGVIVAEGSAKWTELSDSNQFVLRSPVVHVADFSARSPSEYDSTNCRFSGSILLVVS